MAQREAKDGAKPKVGLPARVVVAVAGITALAALALGVARALPAAGSAARPGPAATVSKPPIPVYIRWAGIEYFTAGPADPLVTLRLVLENYQDRHTDSTTLLWDPEFAQRFTFLRSEPPAWRVRTDERGWGVLDTAGILPHQYGEFRLWFAATSPVVREPRLVVVSNGNVVVADTVVQALHRQAPRPAAPLSFERGVLGWVGAVVEALHVGSADERSAFLLAATVGALLAVLAGAGSAAAFWSVRHQA